MTKNVRIENADTGTHFIPVVQTWNRSNDGITPDVLVKEEDLTYPTTLGTFMIHSHQYLIVKEKQ
jgi:hypothetical protein